MTPELKKELLGLVTDVHGFVKGANALLTAQCGDEIDKQARQTVKAMADCGVFQGPVDLESEAQKLRFAKPAAFDGLTKLSRRLRKVEALIEQGPQLGTAIEKGAGDDSSEQSSEDIYRTGFSGLAARVNTR